jgi:thiol peroxidase
MYNRRNFMGKKNITFKGNQITLIGTEIRTGEKAPNFKGIKQNLEEFDFYKETGENIKVISTAPSLDTKVCSEQALKFDELSKGFGDKVVIINITADLPYAQQKFCSENNIENISIISDHKYLDFGGKYGFVIKEMRMLSRGVIVVDEHNVVRYVEYVDEITNNVDFDKVKEVVEKIKQN